MQGFLGSRESGISGSREAGASTAVAGALVYLLGIGVMIVDQPLIVLIMFGAVGSAAFLYALRNPVSAYGLLILTWITVYSRLQFPLFELSSVSQQGTISLVEILWLATLGALVLRVFHIGQVSSGRNLGLPVIMILPYVLATVLLPLLGVLAYARPITYAISGLRILQWATFGVMAYWLSLRYGPEDMFCALTRVLVIAMCAHALYAGVQMMAFLTGNTETWLKLDALVTSRSMSTWFLYPRTTGFLVNPNSLGVLGAVGLVVVISAWFSGHSPNRRVIVPGLAAGVWVVLSSGSRTALLALAAAMLGFLVVGSLRLHSKGGRRVARRVISGSVTGVLMLFLVVGLGYSVLPEALAGRLSRLLQVILGDVEADANAVGRFAIWSEVLREQMEHYPMGTLVAPSYALASPVDSYYVFTAAQGTVAYLVLFVVALLGVTWLGLSVFGRRSELDDIGLSMVGLVCVVAGSSIAMSPLLEAPIAGIFWSLTGIALAARSYRPLVRTPAPRPGRRLVRRCVPGSSA